MTPHEPDAIRLHVEADFFMRSSRGELHVRSGSGENRVLDFSSLELLKQVSGHMRSIQMNGLIRNDVRLQLRGRHFLTVQIRDGVMNRQWHPVRFLLGGVDRG